MTVEGRERYPINMRYARDFRRTSIPLKLGAMQLLAKMCGWQTPGRHEIEHGFKEKQDSLKS